MRVITIAICLFAGTALAQTVTVDGAVEHQTIQGGGTTFNAEGDPFPIPWRTSRSRCTTWVSG